MNKPTVEFLYDNQNDITRIYTWKGILLVDKKSIKGILSKKAKELIKNELIKLHGNKKGK